MVTFSGGGDFKVSFMFFEVSPFTYNVICKSFCGKSFCVHERNVDAPVSRGGLRSMDRQKQCHQVLERSTILFERSYQLVLL